MAQTVVWIGIKRKKWSAYETEEWDHLYQFLIGLQIKFYQAKICKYLSLKYENLQNFAQITEMFYLQPLLELLQAVLFFSLRKGYAERSWDKITYLGPH